MVRRWSVPPVGSKTQLELATRPHTPRKEKELATGGKKGKELRTMNPEQKQFSLNRAASKEEFKPLIA